MSPIVRLILEHVGLPEVKYGSYEHRRLCREALIKYIEALEIEKKRLSGDYSDDVTSLFPFEPRGHKTANQPTNTSMEKGLLKTIDELRENLEFLGNPVDVPDIDMDSVVGTVQSHKEPVLPAPEVVTLKEVLEEHRKKNTRWKEAAVEAYERYTRRLLQHFDESTPIDSIDYKAMEKF